MTVIFLISCSTTCIRPSCMKIQEYNIKCKKSFISPILSSFQLHKSPISSVTDPVQPDVTESPGEPVGAGRPGCESRAPRGHTDHHRDQPLLPLPVARAGRQRCPCLADTARRYHDSCAHLQPRSAHHGLQCWFTHVCTSIRLCQTIQ